jgi:hypothetical protein
VPGIQQVHDELHWEWGKQYYLGCHLPRIP